MSKFAVIDFETTGFIPERGDRVVEVGVVLLDRDGQREGSWTTLVNPKRDVGASHVHGITAGELLDAPVFSDIGDIILDLLSGRTVVAHNATFDMRFLHHELQRAGYQVADRPPALCSMKWSRSLLGQAKLAHCCEALDIPLENAHTALADAEATASLLVELARMGGSYPEWQEDLLRTRTFAWPGVQGLGAPQLAFRSTPSQQQPSSWMQSVLGDVGVTGNSEDEAGYLLALNNSLLDFHISATEGRGLGEIARHSRLSAARLLELHRLYLEDLASEAWSDGVLTDEEVSDLQSAAACMGLTDQDVTQALAKTEQTQNTPRKALLQTGDRVVFTGTLETPRTDWIAQITAAGLCTGGISKSTRVVVSADPDSLSGKAAKARDYGIPVIDERAFRKHFDEYRQS